MNYMDYIDDDAMFMFTIGQIARMNATLAGPRSSLVHDRWLHAREEDSPDELVFRPEGYPLPLARGREEIELGEDGELRRARPRPGRPARRRPRELDEWYVAELREDRLTLREVCAFAEGAELRPHDVRVDRGLADPRAVAAVAAGHGRSRRPPGRRSGGCAGRSAPGAR